MPTLYPPLELEREEGRGNEMLSAELKESFETAHAIHRAQRRLQDEYFNTKPDIESIVEADLDNDPVRDVVHIPKKRKRDLNNNSLDDTKERFSLFEELEARKFEAALAAAVTAESEISNLSNGIAELEAMLRH